MRCISEEGVKWGRDDGVESRHGLGGEDCESEWLRDFEPREKALEKRRAFGGVDTRELGRSWQGNGWLNNGTFRGSIVVGLHRLGKA